MRSKATPAGNASPATAGADSRAPAAPAATAVELHVDELVLHGFSRADRFAVSDALERELARRFAGQGVPALLTAPLEIERLDAGAFTAKAGTPAHAIGEEIAARLYQGLSPQPSRGKTDRVHGTSTRNAPGANGE
jgi:hypothetical protein